MAKDKGRDKPKRAALSGPNSGKKPKHSLDGNRASKGGANQRDASTVRRLQMYKKTPTRDKRGRIVHEDLQSKDLPSTRIQPDRRWFGNTRVIGQKQLESFRTEMATKVNDAYSVLLREKKLPLQLLEDTDKKASGKQARHNLLATQPFQDTFGGSAKRKRPRLIADSVTELMERAEQRVDKFDESAPSSSAPAELKDMVRDPLFEKGQSRRIWGELYKVLDSSDVVIQVLDARDPMGTRCHFLEQHIRKHLRHKHLLLLLNKCDLVPSWVTKRWLHHLSREFPTLAFHASITNPFGKGALLSLLRQLARLRSDKQAISVGFVGYPNVGKSSVINTLRTKKVCKTAPIPGETKIWQYITLMKRIFLIDCPGVVYNRTSDSEADIVLKGVVRVENLEAASEYIPSVLARVKPEYLKRAYKVHSWTDAEDFLTQLARLSGKLLKGGDPDLNTAARMVLLDWQRGKVPFFTLPPGYQDVAPGTSPSDVDQPPELPVPVGAVTEEDAVGEAGARPEEAAAAAKATRELMSAATTQQTRTRIPVQQDYFMPEDEGKANDFLPGQGDELEVSVDEDSDADSLSQPSDSSLTGDQECAQSSSGSDGQGTGEAAGELPAQADSDAESDGYGAGGLSWEAVMAAVQAPGQVLSGAEHVGQGAMPTVGKQASAPTAKAGGRKKRRKPDSVQQPQQLGGKGGSRSKGKAGLRLKTLS